METDEAYAHMGDGWQTSLTGETDSTGASTCAGVETDGNPSLRVDGAMYMYYGPTQRPASRLPAHLTLGRVVRSYTHGSIFRDAINRRLYKLTRRMGIPLPPLVLLGLPAIRLAQ